MQLSIVIPAFNEGRKIEADIDAAVAYLNTKDRSELIVVNDGSRDDTAERIRQHFAKIATPSVVLRLLDHEVNRGKGHAVRAGMLVAQGDSVAFVDSGLCVPFAQLDRGLTLLREGADLAIASRRHSDSTIKRNQPAHRKIGSKVFSGVVRSLMGVQFVSDTQCGFKLYSARAARAIFQRSQIDGFMFDVEALLLAHALDLRIEEFPVDWSNDSDTRYDPVFGTLKNFRELCSIRARAWQLKKEVRPWRIEYS